MPRRLVIIALLFCLSVSAQSASAEQIKTEHFIFHVEQGSEQNTARLAANAEKRLSVLCTMLEVCDAIGDVPIQVWLAPDAERFAAAFGHPTPMAEWAVGVTFVGQGKIVLRAHGSALFTLEETFDHELSHELLYRAVGIRGVPRWFGEGVAIWQAGEAVLKRLVPAQQAAMTGNLKPLDELGAHFPHRGPAVGLAYAQAGLFVHWLQGRYGPETVVRLVKRTRESSSFDDAFTEVIGASIPEVQEAWEESLEPSQSWMLLLSDINLHWSLLTALFLLVAWRKRQQKQAQLEAMARQESYEAAEELLEEREQELPPVLH